MKMDSNTKQKGYACQMPAMIDLWRQTWSATKGTTEPLAPFGLVDIHAGGGEGQGPDGIMGNFRCAHKRTRIHTNTHKYIHTNTQTHIIHKHTNTQTHKRLRNFKVGTNCILRGAPK